MQPSKYDSVSANRKCTSLISCSVCIFFTWMLKSLPLKILLVEILGVLQVCCEGDGRWIYLLRAFEKGV